MPQPSISQRLHDNLATIIASTQPGQRLPSEPTLAKILGVSRATLREVMRTFESQGLLRRKQGSGTYVTRPSAIIESGLEVLESIETLSKRIGLSVKMSTKFIEVCPANEDECKALGLETDHQVIHISQVIEVENRPVAYLINIVPTNIFSPTELETGYNGSVLDMFLQRGVPPISLSRTEIIAVMAPVEVTRALGLQYSEVLLCFIAYLFDSNGRIVDYSHSYFLPGYFNFHVIRRIGSTNSSK